MRSNDFEHFLGLLSRLSRKQRDALAEVLAAGDREAAVVAILETRLGDRPCCVHCHAERPYRWGFSHGLQRWRCRDCRRSFNALTGTPLARLRKKIRWLDFAETLSEGLSVKAAARRCDVALSTSFRWRHRFLSAGGADEEALSGIIESDETVFRLSFKGSREWKDGKAPLKRAAKKRGSGAKSDDKIVEQVPVLITRDRSGATRAAVLPDRTAEAIAAAIGSVLPKDCILCTDSWRGFSKFAREHHIRHETVNLHQGERVRDKVWHIQNVNAHHSRLKQWVISFKGISTRYLTHYLNWHHATERMPDTPDHTRWLKSALSTANAN